jgi:hypothetical protein
MRGRITALLTAGLLALVAAGCGGSDTPATQVPGPPADVTVPESSNPPGSGSGSGSDSSSSATPTATSTPDSGTGGTSGDTGTTTGSTGTGTTGDANGGTAAPDTGTDSASNDQPPPDGSNAQQFEDFCAQNPGAC